MQKHGAAGAYVAGPLAYTTFGVQPTISDYPMTSVKVVDYLDNAENVCTGKVEIWVRARPCCMVVPIPVHCGCNVCAHTTQPLCCTHMKVSHTFRIPLL